MKISRRSWHYRLYRYICNIPRGSRYVIPFGVEREDKTPPRSLCPYAWSILLGLVGVAVVGSILAVGAAVAAPFVAVAWVATRSWRALKAATRAANDRVARIDLGLPRIPLPRVPLPRLPRREPREGGSLLLAAIRAKKDRVCPTIELVD